MLTRSDAASWGRSEGDASADPTVLAARKTPATIVVVDDDPSMLRAIQRLLSSVGFQVLAFDNAEAAMASELPGGALCLLTDIHLPGASGVELSQVLKSRNRVIPAILMTAHSDARTRQLADSATAVATLYKPFDEEALLEAIHRALLQS